MNFQTLNNSSNASRKSALRISLALMANLLLLCASAKPTNAGASNLDVAKFCSRAAKELRVERKPGSKKHITVDSFDLGARAISYIGVDLDQDGKSDELIQSCGSPGDGQCTLNVALSSGGSFEFQDRPFRIIKLQRTYYIVVGDSFPPEQTGTRTIHKISMHGSTLICNNI